VEEPKLYTPVSAMAAIRAGMDQIKQTIKEIKNLRVVGIFLAAYWLYIDGVDTIIRMAVDCGISLGFPPASLIAALLIVQFVAFPCTLLFNGIAARVGAKRAILGAIGAYGLITVLGAAMTSQWHFFALAVAIGMVQGGIQAISRSLYTRLIPASKAAQFFGIYNMVGKFAAVIGPGMMGAVTLVTGNVRTGILSVLILFILGFVLLLKVDVAEGERIAREQLS
ncbi:MAG: MFS transporter, partial [Syntrophales bacterium]|nr:MFS transporter [Syntrophales bacterium]